MAYSKVQSICDKHNKEARMVRHVRTYSPDNFFALPVGNHLITGGADNQRRAALCAMIRNHRQKMRSPMIIFSESPTLCSELISMANAGETGKLYVCSGAYRNYDFFHKMSLNQIVDYFTEISQLMNYGDARELANYAGAFLRILEKAAPVKLATIVQFANNTDDMILELAQRYGLYSESDIIRASAGGGISFRRLITSTEEAFFEITTSDCDTGFNIAEAAGRDCMVLIDTNTKNYELLAAYFVRELKDVSTKPFTVVFDQCSLLNNTKLSELVNMLKQRGNINVVISHENVMALPGEEVFKNFNKFVVFLNGMAPSQDIQKILTECFGEYQHFEPSKTVTTPARLFFNPKKAEGDGIITFTKPKVRLEEEIGYSVGLYGHNGMEIIVARNF